MERYGRCVVAVSEGIADAKGVPVANSLMAKVEKDAHGNVELGGGALADFLTRSLKQSLGYQAGAGRHLRLSATQLRGLRLGCRSARGARGGRKRPFSSR